MTLCTGTPKITVRDNRGLGVRGLRYNRSVDGAVATQYVDAQTHNVLGQPQTSQDPRFFGSPTLNFQNTPALSGQILQTVSADAGTSEACTDISGQPIWQHSQGRDSDIQTINDITVRLYYDALGRPVRRGRVMVDVYAGGPVGDNADIWSYGDYSGPAGATYDPTDTTDTRNANQRGQLFQHFDTAGLIDMSAQGYAIQGTTLRRDRRFQRIPCDSLSRWQPGTLQSLYGLNKWWLEPDTDPANLYSTRWAYTALGQVSTQIDAKGHQQHTAYDCAGRKYTASVTPSGGTLTPVCASISYTAAGAIDTRSDANNIRVAYTYEPQTSQRLISLTASRSAAANSAALQALTYAYDGVGNVISLSNSSADAQVSFFRNRAVTPDRGYTYDALYQLTSASGRENYVNNTPKGCDWPGAQFNPATTADYQAYTRSYTYDCSGNLTGINSSNWSGAKRTMVVSASSNRAVSTANNAGATSANIDTYFDPAGQSIYLDANRNRPLYWTSFQQLYCVVTTYRPPTPGAFTGDWFNCDREQYAYDGGGQRVRKYASSKANSTWNTLDNRYLPGLELRDNSASGENLEVIVLDDGARILNWAGGAGKPSDIPNLQLRFQYADRQNSCQIETDSDGNVITQEEYYPYGGTAVLASRSNSEVKYKYIRYSGKERDATGLYYYGLRYYQPWIGRWINPDPAGPVDGQNIYCMVGNNPVTYIDAHGAVRDKPFPIDDLLRFLDDDSPPPASPRLQAVSPPARPAAQQENLNDRAAETVPRNEVHEMLLKLDLLHVGFDWIPITAQWPEDSARAYATADSSQFAERIRQEYGKKAKKLWRDAITYVAELYDPPNLVTDAQRFSLLLELAGIKSQAWDERIAGFRILLAAATPMVNSTGHLNASTQQVAFQNWMTAREAALGSTDAPPASKRRRVESPAGSSLRSADNVAWSRYHYVRDQLLSSSQSVLDPSKKTIGYRILTRDPHRPEHQFDLEISEEKLRILKSFRYQKTPNYFASDVTAYQTHLGLTLGGIDLRKTSILEINNVVNADTTSLLEKYEETRDAAPEIGIGVRYDRWGAGDDRLDEFLTTTPHGKRVTHLMDDMGKSVTAMWQYLYDGETGKQTDLFFFMDQSAQPRHPALR